MRYAVFIVLAIFGCSQTNSTESQSSTDSILADTVQAAPEKSESKEQVAEVSVPAKIPVSSEYLMEFPLSTHLDEALFSDGGSFALSGLTGDSQKTGTWFVSGDSLKITVNDTTARFLVNNLGPDDFELIAEDEFGAKLFRKGPTDYSGDGYTQLFRNTFSPPFTKEALHGQWSDPVYGSGFNPDGKFVHSEPDCWSEGSWKFNGEDLFIKETKSNCDLPPPRQFKVIRLSRKQMVLKRPDGLLEVWLRQGN